MKDSAPFEWETLRRQSHADCKVFGVDKLRCRHPGTGAEGDFYAIVAPDWAVAAALTDDGRLALARQWRFAAQTLTWELPAGCVDDGETPLEAAARELREETGLAGDNGRIIGVSLPNPALQGNRCHIAFFENARRIGPPQPGEFEEIETRMVSVEEAYAWAREGKIQHAVALNALFAIEPELRMRGFRI